ncbi:MAG: RNA polymerase sigma factor [Limisphaerales bacterium]
MPDPEPNATQTRASLVQGLQAGDEDRWQQFYRLYGPVIRGFALKAGLTETEADEVMQETCIGLAKNVGEFQYDPAKCRFKTWLLNLASWRVKNQFAKRQRWDERVHGRPNPVPNDPARTATVDRVADPNARTIEVLWDEEWRGSVLKTALEKVRAKVSATQFQVFDLNVLKEWPAGDVAKSLGLNIASVYLAKHRVSAALKKEVARLEVELSNVTQSNRGAIEGSASSTKPGGPV